MDKYETPKQYKKRTDKDLPESAPVYCKDIYNWRVIGWHDCIPYYIAKLQNWEIIITANESGKPPTDWREK